VGWVDVMVRRERAERRRRQPPRRVGSAVIGQDCANPQTAQGPTKNQFRRSNRRAVAAHGWDRRLRPTEPAAQPLVVHVAATHEGWAGRHDINIWTVDTKVK
jgi:hypothetical protein